MRRTGAFADDLESQPAVRIDFQHVNRNMWGIEANDPFERLAPARFGLKG